MYHYIKLILAACMSLFILTACNNDNSSTNSAQIDSTEYETNIQEQESEPESSLDTEDEENSNTEKESVQEKKENTFEAKIVKVIDGDTVKIELPNGTEETVRLLLIDTPETVHPTKDIQPFGPEASQFSKDLMPSNSTVEVEVGIGERDKYGRLLAYFYVDGKMINKLLLEKGLARVAYVYAPNTKYLDEFEAIQKKAQQKEIGIWSIENYVTSRGFTETNSENQKENSTVTNSSSCSKPTIKGNINWEGEKIYHIPSGQYYSITKAEEMFCTEQEAQEAGYRQSER